MKKINWKRLLPHGIAIVVFVAVSALFCKPALEGNVLNQHDIIGWKGMAQNAFEYKAKHGHFPLWNPSLFSGMPNYQVAMEGKTVLPDLTKPLSLWMPKPINFFLLACICFYILCLALKLNPAIGIFSSLAFAFSTYNPVIIAAGHESQMFATSFMPLVVAGLILTYTKRYWLGLAVTTYAAYQQIAFNHLQISYYTFLIAALITLVYLIKWIKENQWKHLFISAGITAFAAIVGLAGSAMTLKTTSEYAPFTMRGGKEVEITGDTVKAVKTSGLDTSYAWQYSIGKTEVLTLLMPNAFGGSSDKKLPEDSHVTKKLVARGGDETSAQQLSASLPAYWGKLLYTAGPAYLGVFIFILGLIGFVVVKDSLRWGLLAATILAVFMAWGKYFTGFNLFLFQHLPMYNKFRAPSMAQVIPQFAMGVTAALALQKILFEDKAKEWLRADFKRILYIIGGLFALLAIIYIAQDYSSPFDAQLLSNKWDNSGTDETGRLIVAGIKADRQAMFGGGLLRALAFVLILLGTIFLYLKNLIKPLLAAVIIILVSTGEIFLVSKKYLSEEDYIAKDEYESANFTPSSIDQQILRDKDPDYRVFNMAGDAYNESSTSYFHKSIGGYHPAKLRIYQDVIEKYLRDHPKPEIVNMLNGKYIIVADPKTNQPGLITNPDVLGPCWLVKNVSVVKDRVAALIAIGKIDLKDTAVADASFDKQIIQPLWDSTATIKLTSFDNDAMDYETNAKSPQFAVFSEIYYPKGWNAYVDGKRSDYVNVNYILRGINVPSGQHKIRFVFEPASVKQGRNIMFIASILVGIILLGGLYMGWRGYMKEPLTSNSSGPADS